MATFKACVRKRRNDGFWCVYIRVTHHKKVGYIKTDKMVSDEGLSRAGEIEDPFVLKWCSSKILTYVDCLNRATGDEFWTVQEVIQHLTTINSDVSFSDYAREHALKMELSGQERNAKNYKLALQHLERYAGTTKIMFSQLTSAFLNGWIRSMESTHRAKEMYPVCLRQVYKAAKRELNDEEKEIVRIKHDPWGKVDIPSADKTEKLAITAQACRAFFAAPVPDSDNKYASQDMGRDVAMMVLCLGGINTVDLYNMKKTDYYDGVLHYQRAKTRGSRTDGAYMEMRVPEMLLPTLERYMADKDSEFLLNFHDRLGSSDSFNIKVNKGIKVICESMGMPKEDWYSAYTFRHTWGTLARNDCDAPLSEVAFGMNHSAGFKITRGYIKTDFSPAWRLNEKVVELVFFSERQSTWGAAKRTDEPQPVEKFSKKQLMRGEIYFMGKMLGKVEDIGYSNVDEIIEALLRFVPDDMPNRCKVQIKIENKDKHQVSFYERMKGVGF